MSRAAGKVFSNQPSVSKWIRELEADLGTELFERSTQGIVPTPAAERLFRHALPLVHALDRLPETFAERYRGEIAGALRIGAGQISAAALLPPYLGRFRESCPGVEVHVKVGNGPERLEWLRSFEVDLVIGTTGLDEPDLEYHSLVESDIVLITPEDHPLAGRASVDLAEATAYPAVTHPADHYMSRVGDMVLRRYGLAVNRAVEVGGWNTIKRYVEAGVGISIVPEVCVSDADRVWKIPLPGLFAPRTYAILMRRDATPSLAAERFLGVVDSRAAEGG